MDDCARQGAAAPRRARRQRRLPTRARGAGRRSAAIATSARPRRPVDNGFLPEAEVVRIQRMQRRHQHSAALRMRSALVATSSSSPTSNRGSTDVPATNDMTNSGGTSGGSPTSSPEHPRHRYGRIREQREGQPRLPQHVAVQHRRHARGCHFHDHLRAVGHGAGIRQTRRAAGQARQLVDAERREALSEHFERKFNRRHRQSASNHRDTRNISRRRSRDATITSFSYQPE